MYAVIIRQLLMKIISLGHLVYYGTDKEWAGILIDEVIDQQLKRIEEGGDIWAFTRWILAGAYSVKGDTESALKWLEDAVDRGWTRYQWIEIDPRFDTIRDDPRYTEFIDRMKAIVSRERMEAGYTS